MSSNKQSDSPNLSVSVNLSEVNGSDEKENQLTTTLNFNSTAKVKRTKEYDFSSGKKITDSNYSPNTLPTIHEVRDAKDDTRDNKDNTTSYNISYKSAKAKENYTNEIKKVLKNDIKEELKVGKQKKKRNKKKNKESNDINRNKEHEENLTDDNTNNMDSTSFNSSFTPMSKEIKSTGDNTNLTKFNKSNSGQKYSNSKYDNANINIEDNKIEQNNEDMKETPAQPEESEGLNKVISQISFQQEGMEKDATFELKKTFTDTFSDPRPHRNSNPTIDTHNDMDMVREAEDSDDDKLLVLNSNITENKHDQVVQDCQNKVEVNNNQLQSNYNIESTSTADFKEKSKSPVQPTGSNSKQASAHVSSQKKVKSETKPMLETVSLQPAYSNTSMTSNTSFNPANTKPSIGKVQKLITHYSETFKVPTTNSSQFSNLPVSATLHQSNKKENQNKDKEPKQSQLESLKSSNQVVTGGLRESYTRSLTIIKKAEDSLSNMSKKQGMGAKGLTMTSSSDLMAFKSNDSTTNIGIRHSNYLQNSKSENINNVELYSNNSAIKVNNQSPNRLHNNKSQKDNQIHTNLNSHYYSSYHKSDSKDVREDLQSETLSLDSVDKQEKSIFLGISPQRSLSKSKSKRNLLNDSIPRSKTKKEQSDFKYDKKTEEIIIQRLSEERIETSKVSDEQSIKLNFDDESDNEVVMGKKTNLDKIEELDEIVGNKNNVYYKLKQVEVLKENQELKDLNKYYYQLLTDNNISFK